MRKPVTVWVVESPDDGGVYVEITSERGNVLTTTEVAKDRRSALALARKWLTARIHRYRLAGVLDS